MKKKISLMLATLLLSCSFIFAQNGGIPVELKPFNPPNKPPFGNITNNTTISVSSLPESLYLIVAQTKDGNILNEKIIVKH